MIRRSVGRGGEVAPEFESSHRFPNNLIGTSYVIILAFRFCIPRRSIPLLAHRSRYAYMLEI